MILSIEYFALLSVLLLFTNVNCDIKVSFNGPMRESDYPAVKKYYDALPYFPLPARKLLLPVPHSTVEPTCIDIFSEFLGGSAECRKRAGCGDRLLYTERHQTFTDIRTCIGVPVYEDVVTATYYHYAATECGSRRTGMPLRGGFDHFGSNDWYVADFLVIPFVTWQYKGVCHLVTEVTFDHLVQHNYTSRTLPVRKTDGGYCAKHLDYPYHSTYPCHHHPLVYAPHFMHLVGHEPRYKDDVEFVYYKRLGAPTMFRTSDDALTAFDGEECHLSTPNNPYDRDRKFVTSRIPCVYHVPVHKDYFGLLKITKQVEHLAERVVGAVLSVLFRVLPTLERFVEMVLEWAGRLITLITNSLFELYLKLDSSFYITEYSALLVFFSYNFTTLSNKQLLIIFLFFFLVFGIRR